MIEFPKLVSSRSENKELKVDQKINKTRLINILNYINFQDGTILINLKHFKFNHIISLKAKPLPCSGDEVECLWAEPARPFQALYPYQFKEILVPDGGKLLLIEPNWTSINKKGISVRLPEACIDVSSRKVRRCLCGGIKVQLIQNSTIFCGTLIDFSPVSFRVEVTAEPPQTFQWIDPQNKVNLIFSDKNETLYSGECGILRQSGSYKKREFVIAPLSQQIRRFKPKKYRSTRQRLVPSPDVIFIHPFTKKIDRLKAIDVAALGFSVEEDVSDSVLLLGMIIPKLELNFMNSVKIECKAQVVYKKTVDEEGYTNRVRCGLALLDIRVEDHCKLLSLLYHATNKNVYFCNKVDLDKLWEFFFKTGFIYPQKYNFIESNKDKIKEVYKKLYTENPKIARHFIYQNNGRILGHLAMVRFYENSWLIQHHAADLSYHRKAGLIVLNQIGRFINDSHSLNSLNMNYVFCYFRPENKFPKRVFAGAAENINDPKGCSLDTFSYFHYRKTLNSELDLKEPWSLEKIQPEDLMELKSFYENSSGGLMLNALELELGSVNIDKLKEEFKRISLKREKHLFSLKMDGYLKAVVVVNISDIGLNLSDLTNSIHVIILDPDGLPSEIIKTVFSMLTTAYDQNEISILLYPSSYAKNHHIPSEKLYKFWALNMQYTDHYFSYIESLLKKIG